MLGVTDCEQYWSSPLGGVCSTATRLPVRGDALLLRGGGEDPTSV